MKETLVLNSRKCNIATKFQYNYMCVRVCVCVHAHTRAKIIIFITILTVSSTIAGLSTSNSVIVLPGRGKYIAKSRIKQTIAGYF